MNIEKELSKNNIIVKRKANIEEKNYIAKIIAEKLANNVKELFNSYNEIYMRIFNCDMYYATVDEKFCGVFYFYKNNTIYIDEMRQIENIDFYLLHEILHYMQNFSKINKNSNRVGLCQFNEFKIFGLGLNEAIVQYITAKALGLQIHRINNAKISICTNSENYYKYLTSLVCQVVLLLGEKEAINSCINSTEVFENQLYNTFEENTEKILKNFDLILEMNNKKERDEDKIIEIYMKTQEIIYTSYFTKMYKRLTTLKEVDTQVQKLQDYEKIVGKLMNVSNLETPFYKFKQDMESKFLNKYVEINRRKTRNYLTVVPENFIYSLWRKVLSFFQKNIAKNKM